MTKLEELEQKVADTKAAHAAAVKAHASYSYAWVAYTGPAAHAACIVLVHAEAAYLQAIDELKEYRRPDEVNDEH